VHLARRKPVPRQTFVFVRVDVSQDDVGPDFINDKSEKVHVRVQVFSAAFQLLDSCYALEGSDNEACERGTISTKGK